MTIKDRRWIAPVRIARGWLGGSRLGLVAMALVVGAAAGLGAVVFRELVYGFTWLVTGYEQFGQQGHAPSLHLPELGIVLRSRRTSHRRAGVWAPDLSLRA